MVHPLKTAFISRFVIPKEYIGGRRFWYFGGISGSKLPFRPSPPLSPAFIFLIVQVFARLRFQRLLDHPPGQLFQRPALTDHFIMSQPFEIDFIRQVVPPVPFLFLSCLCHTHLLPLRYFYLIFGIYTNYGTGSDFEGFALAI